MIKLFIISLFVFYSVLYISYSRDFRKVRKSMEKLDENIRRYEAERIKRLFEECNFK